jgi:RNA polymerase sigma-70 factor (ECF subfamily)
MSETTHRGGRVTGDQTPDPLSSHRDDVVFRDLYKEHLQGVFGLANRMCGPKLAPDVTQEVFLQLWQQPERFDPSKGSLHSLLLTMTHHKSIDLIRSNRARTSREHRTAFNPAEHLELDEGLLRNEMAVRVSRAVNQLPEHLKDAIVTTFYGDCTYKETATVLGQPEGTIKSRIRLGLEQLREALAEVA